MIRDSNIPLFLWIATALCVHLFSGGGAEQGMKVLDETREIRRFAGAVHRHVSVSNQALEITVFDGSEDPSAPPPETEPVDVPTEEESSELDEPEQPELKPEPPAPEEKPKQPEAKPEPKPPEPAKPAVPKEVPVIDAKRRIAVKQQVEDQNQKDNPDAEFIGDAANRVAEQTQARITATDQDDPSPTPGRAFAGPDETPGNATETEIAQSEDRPGDPQNRPDQASDPSKIPELDLGKPPSNTHPSNPTAAWVAPSGQKTPKAAAKEGKETRAHAEEDPGQQAREAVVEAPDLATSDQGKDSVPPKQQAEAGALARPKRLAQQARELRRDPTGWLGLGKSGTTSSGMNLNLTPESALATIGKKELARERKLDTERRLTAHRGSWKPMGLERWRSAIENYVPSVKPGNQTALNTARRPFASYLNQIHNQLHPHFAFQFLPSLDRFPGSHPLNRREMHTALEIVVSGQDGRLVRMGVTYTSGVTAFDIGALESVQRASPFGAPPREILSPDGNAYLHWEFYREPDYACSTYFARPYILKVAPSPAGPPKIEPPSLPPPEERSPADGVERHGRKAPRSPEGRLTLN